MTLLAIRIVLNNIDDAKNNSSKEVIKDNKDTKNLTTQDAQDIQSAIVANVDNSNFPENEFKTMEEDCLRINQHYSNIESIKKNYKTHLLFTNVHKQIDGKIYRLRFFYKDGDNGEVPTYLVYEEDQNEDELIIENSSQKKGPLYQRVERSQGEVIYNAEAYNLIQNDAFLHYENGKLKDLQGDLDISGRGLVHLECRY